MQDSPTEPAATARSSRSWFLANALAAVFLGVSCLLAFISFADDSSWATRTGVVELLVSAIAWGVVALVSVGVAARYRHVRSGHARAVAAALLVVPFAVAWISLFLSSSSIGYGAAACCLPISALAGVVPLVTCIGSLGVLRQPPVP